MIPLWYHPYGRKQEEIKSHLMKVKEESEKVGLKLNIQKTKFMASSPITSWQIDRGKIEKVRDFIFWAPKSLQMATAAMKLKDTYSLEEKLWPTFSSVQSLSRVRLYVTPWIAAHQASLSITKSRSSLKLTSIGSVMPSSHLILGRPLLLLPPIPPSIWIFFNESTLCMRWPKYRSFSFSIIPSKKCQGWSPLEWTGWISLQSKGLSRVFSNTTVQKHQFFGARPSSQSNSHIHTWLLEKP